MLLGRFIGDFDSSKGVFRQFTVRVGGRAFMDYRKVPQRVEMLVDYINDEIKTANCVEDVYRLAFQAHYQLVTIHPFADGNGRTSRLLTNYIQHYHNYPMTLVFSEDKVDYFNALEQIRKKEESSVFGHFMFEQAEKYFKREIQKMSYKMKEKPSPKGGFNFLF